MQGLLTIGEDGGVAIANVHAQNRLRMIQLCYGVAKQLVAAHQKELAASVEAAGLELAEMEKMVALNGDGAFDYERG